MGQKNYTLGHTSSVGIAVEMGQTFRVESYFKTNVIFFLSLIADFPFNLMKKVGDSWQNLLIQTTGQH
jgi:hypothetical protein